MNQPKSGRKPAKKPNILLRVLAFLLTLALMLGAVTLVVYRDRLNLDAFRRWMLYRSIQTSETGQTEPFTHGGGDRLDMACIEGGFLFSSVSGAYCYSSGGTELASQITHMDNPVLSSSSKAGVIYDAGGKSLFLFGRTGQTFSYTPDSGEILSARVNDNGWLTVTALQSRYRGGVTVFNAEHEPVISLNYSSAFVSDAALSPDCATVAVVTIGQTDGSFQSTVHLYRTDEEEAFATVVLDGFTVLDMDFDRTGLWLLGDSSLITLSADGENKQEYRFNPGYLKGYSLEGDGFAVLLLGKYRAGNARDAVTVGPDGQIIARQSLNAQILSLSAAGRYVALLSGRELTVCTSDLNTYSTLDNTLNARHTALYTDGSALLSNGQEAWLYIPS